MNNDSTTALNQLLESLELTAEEKTRNNWARRTKTTFLSYTLRVFENVITHKLMTVTYDAAKDCYYTRLLLDPLCASAGASIKQKLIDALKDVKHCGDYGELFFLANPPTAWVVMGDADGDEKNGFTCMLSSFDAVRGMVQRARRT